MFASMKARHKIFGIAKTAAARDALQATADVAATRSLESRRLRHGWSVLQGVEVDPPQDLWNREDCGRIGLARLSVSASRHKIFGIAKTAAESTVEPYPLTTTATRSLESRRLRPVARILEETLPLPPQDLWNREDCGHLRADWRKPMWHRHKIFGIAKTAARAHRHPQLHAGSATRSLESRRLRRASLPFSALVSWPPQDLWNREDCGALNKVGPFLIHAATRSLESRRLRQQAYKDGGREAARHKIFGIAKTAALPRCARFPSPGPATRSLESRRLRPSRRSRPCFWEQPPQDLWNREDCGIIIVEPTYPAMDRHKIFGIAKTAAKWWTYEQAIQSPPQDLWNREDCGPRSRRTSDWAMRRHKIFGIAKTAAVNPCGQGEAHGPPQDLWNREDCGHADRLGRRRGQGPPQDLWNREDCGGKFGVRFVRADTATRSLESRRLRPARPPRSQPRLVPPQDLWNREDCGSLPVRMWASPPFRHKIFGIAKTAARGSTGIGRHNRPPQDLWNREDCGAYDMYGRKLPDTATRSLESRRLRRSDDVCKSPGSFRHKIFGIAKTAAPWGGWRSRASPPPQDLWNREDCGLWRNTCRSLSQAATRSLESRRLRQRRAGTRGVRHVPTQDLWNREDCGHCVEQVACLMLVRHKIFGIAKTAAAAATAVTRDSGAATRSLESRRLRPYHVPPARLPACAATRSLESRRLRPSPTSPGAPAAPPPQDLWNREDCGPPVMA